VRFETVGGPEVLNVDEVAVRDPAEGELRIRVEAAGLNRSDSIFRSGYHPVQPVFPTLLGSEAAGTVESLGPGVTGFEVGEIVSVIPRMAPEHGTLGELINVPARFVTRHPAQLSMVEASALWAPFLTAHGGLVLCGGIAKGDLVVITAASSSVGLAAIQIANMLGAVPIATTRDRSKAQQIADAGAQHVIVMDEEDVSARIMEISGGKGARIVFDAIAGPGMQVLAGVLGFKGIYVLYGVMSPEPTIFPIQAAFAEHLTFKTYVLEAGRDSQQPGIDFISRGIESGKLHPIVDRIFAIEDVVDAFHHLESNRQVGKIVLDMAEKS
jgi:NADPH:quinone reductase-like Zn-dependent oxidoreductase